MPFQLHHAARLGALEEGVFQRIVFQPETHIHARAVLLTDAVDVKPALIQIIPVLIQIIIEKPSLGDVVRFDGRYATLGEQPFEHQSGDIDRIGWRRIQHGIVICLLLPIEG